MQMVFAGWRGAIRLRCTFHLKRIRKAGGYLDSVTAEHLREVDLTHPLARVMDRKPVGEPPVR